MKEHIYRWLRLVVSHRAIIKFRRIVSARRWRQKIFDEIQFNAFAKQVTMGSKAKQKAVANSEKILIIDGNDHEIIWAIRWGLLQTALMRSGYRPIVLTRHTSGIQNKYYRLFGCSDFRFIDDFFDQKHLPEDIVSGVDAIFRHGNLKNSLLGFSHKEIPVGKITLSGYARYQMRGDVNFLSSSDLQKLRKLLLKNLLFAHHVEEFLRPLPDVYITSEAFHDDHGVFYYYLLNREVNLIKMNQSVMDDCIVVQKRNKDNEGMHHNTVLPETFNHVSEDPALDEHTVRQFVLTNFGDRYSDKWHLSKRNFRNTIAADRDHLIAEYNLDPKKRIVTIFSHILYDTLFFFEDELYANYADWLLDTVRIAADNPNVNWLIKLHPSNVWRGELGEREYEETRILRQAFKELPGHIHVIPPSTKTSPISWIQHSDIGITVRGTIGMELPCFGNQVITAATGRYAGLGFTNDPRDVAEYRRLLARVHELPRMTEEQIRLARYYYYTMFRLKPMRFSMLRPTLRKGFNEVGLLGSLYSTPSAQIDLNSQHLWPEVESFSRWVEEKGCIDYLDQWERYAVKNGSSYV